MESTFRGMFGVGVLGGLAWLGYVEFQPVTPLVEAVGVFWLALTIVSLALWGALWARGRVVSPIAGLKSVTRVQWLVVAGLVVAMIGGWQALKVTQRSQADRTSALSYARTQCAKWLNKEYNGGNRANPAWANGAWVKNGHVVVEVAWKANSWDRSLTSRLCVYNPETRKMNSPGAFGRDRWEQY